MQREQAIVREIASMISKLCVHAARDFQSQQNGAVTRIWRSGLSSAFTQRTCDRCGSFSKRRGCCCNLCGGVALIDCVIHHKRDVGEE